MLVAPSFLCAPLSLGPSGSGSVHHEAEQPSPTALFFRRASALAEFDAENRFRIRAAAGSATEGLHLLDKLDRAEARLVSGRHEEPR